jgi:uncharacterized protein (TIRG00374 family)
MVANRGARRLPGLLITGTDFGYPYVRTDAVSKLASRRLGRLVVSVVVLAGVTYVLRGEFDHLDGAWRALQRVDWRWFALAVGLEACAIFSFAPAQGRLLAAGGVRLPLRTLLAMVAAGNALSVSLPAGQAVCSGFLFQQFRRRGASAMLAAAAVVLSGFMYAASLATVGLAAVLVTDHFGWSGRAAAIGVTLALVLAVAGLHRARRHRFGRNLAALAARVLDSAAGRSRRLAELLADSRRGWTGFRLRPRDVAITFWLSLLYWGGDFGCMAAACQAVGVRVGVRELLLAYGLAQAVGMLPLTPGGIGIMEGGLAAALVAFGSPAAPAVAVVALYRLVSFWAPLPAGWAAWFALRRHPAVDAAS